MSNGSDDPRTANAIDLLNMCGSGAIAVSKPIRAGLTTSMKYAAQETGKRVIMIEPTRRILNETVGAGAVRVPGNYECSVIAQEIDEFPVLAHLPLPLPDCRRCGEYSGCPVTQILRAPDYKIVTITYAKIRALMLAGSKTATEIKEKLQKADYVLLDEAHLIGFDSVPSVNFAALPPVLSPYRRLLKVRDRWVDFMTNHAAIHEEIENIAKNGGNGKSLSRYAYVPDPIDWRTLRGAWKELVKAAKSGDMDLETLLKYRDATEILSYGWAVIHYVTEDEGRAGHVAVSGSHAKGEHAISKFLHNVVPYAGHVYASGTLMEPHPGLFSELSGKTIKQAIFPDTLNIADKVNLIPDKWSLTNRSFKSKFDDIKSQIKQIVARENQPVYLLAPNKNKKMVLIKAVKEMGLKGVFVDHYRSDLSIGVSHTEKVCIAVGRAEVPTHAYDPLAWGREEAERWEDGQRIREMVVQGDTWQAVNRVRDPEGKEESRIYFIGVRADEIRKLSTWGEGRTVTPMKTNRLDRGAVKGNGLKYSVEVKTPVEHCKIIAEVKYSNHSEMRRLGDMISQIELYDGNSINSENHSLFHSIIYMEKGVKLGIYNNPSYESEVDLNVTSLYNTFVLRDNVYAEQSKKGGYSKINAYCRFDVLKNHVEHKRTIGVYQISLDDTVKWVCIDIDTHEKTDDQERLNRLIEEARAKVLRIVEVLKSYHVPYMLEASGSPGSYHVWVLLKETATYNAYVFVRQITREANVKDAEEFPKQKSLGKDGMYGNLVKLPLGYNHRSGAFSMFIDENFEPLEGRVQVPGRVVLMEIPKPEKKTSPVSGFVSEAVTVNNELDHCMKMCLGNKMQLTGTGGHRMRLAIAIKALVIDMNMDDIIDLYSYHDDFKPDYTRQQIESARGKKPFSCETLKATCGEFASMWCEGCKFRK